MAIYLDEVHLGSDPELIGFPHILLCMGFIYVTSAKMYGIHLTNKEDTERAIIVFNQWLMDNQVNKQQATAIYGSANLKIRYNSRFRGRTKWEGEMKSIAKLLGYKGDAYGFDTSIIHPRDGTYIEYKKDSLKEGKCKIFYKRNEKMNYGKKKHHNTVMKITSDGKLRNDSFVFSFSSATVQKTSSNKGKLHEVDLARRLMKCNTR